MPHDRCDEKGQVIYGRIGAFDHIWEEEKEQVLGADEAIARAAVHGGPSYLQGSRLMYIKTESCRPA